MTCKLKVGDKVFLFDNNQYFVDGVGFMDAATFTKCELDSDYRLSIERVGAASASPEPIIVKGAGSKTQELHNPIINPDGLSPQDAIQMGGGNVWITILLLLFSFFGGGKLSKFLELKDSNLAKLDELSDAVKDLRASIKDERKAMDVKHDEIDKNLDRLAIAIHDIQDQVLSTEKANQRLMSKYEILLSDDIPDLDEIIIRLQKIEKQYKDILLGGQVIEPRKANNVVITDEKNLNGGKPASPKPIVSKRGSKNNDSIV